MRTAHFSMMQSFPIAIAVTIVVSNDSTNMEPEVLPQSSIDSPIMLSPCLSSNAPLQSKSRKDLLIFLRVLLDHLEVHDPSLREKVRAAMSYIIHENRKGNTMHQPLACSIQRHARAIVGNYHWNQVTSIVASMKRMSRMNSDIRFS